MSGTSRASDTSGTSPVAKAALALTIVFIAAAAAFAGWVAGRDSALGGLVAQIEAFDVTQTVGGVAGPDRASIAQAYDDPEKALREMDAYAWQVATIPSPFVCVAPAPGDHPGTHINPQQLRHPTPIAIPKEPGTFRVFVTGGSTAFGTAAPSDDTTITAFLQELCDRELAHTGRRYEILNAANAAWASTHERILITNRLSELQPDLVVSFSGNNDAHFGFIGLHSLWFRTYAEHHFAMLLSDVLAIVGDGPFPVGGTWSPASDGPVAVPEVARRLEKNLKLASVALADAGAPYVFCLQPTLATTEKALSERERGHLDAEKLGTGSADYFRRCYAAYQKRLPRLTYPGFHFVDASTTFDEHGADEEIFLDSYHFGDRGNRILAARLFELLRPFLE